MFFIFSKANLYCQISVYIMGVYQISCLSCLTASRTLGPTVGFSSESPTTTYPAHPNKLSWTKHINAAVLSMS